LRWINCGYPPPLLIRDLKPIMTLDYPPRPPLGLAASETPVHNERLQPGDRVLFYSDGIIEARSPRGTLFGLDRLTDLVISNTAQGMPAPETLRRLTHAILDYQQGRLTDDATILFVEWSPDDHNQLVP
jgi:serine phosphatase RsbU (regulator of sigma subunit)